MTSFSNNNISNKIKTIMEYQKPTKRILTNDHVKIFNESSTYDDLINFITTLNDSIVGVKLSDQIIESNVG